MRIFEVYILRLLSAEKRIHECYVFVYVLTEATKGDYRFISNMAAAHSEKQPVGVQSLYI